jgi:integrase
MVARPEPEAGGSGGDTFQILRRWQDWMDVSGRHAETTRRQYRRYAFAFCADTLIPLDELTEDDVVEYLATLSPKGGMRGQTIRALSSLCTFASRRGLIGENPMSWISVPREKYGPAPYLTPTELEQVFSAAERIDPRARPTLELLYTTGARVGSLCSITIDDVDTLKHLISFRVAKGSKPYTNPLNDRAMRAVQNLLDLAAYSPAKAAGRRDTLVGVASCIVQRWCREAGEMVGLRVYPHLLRHTFCERIANDPAVPELAVVELMNWRDASQIRRYAQARGSIKRQAVAPL